MREGIIEQVQERTEHPALYYLAAEVLKSLRRESIVKNIKANKLESAVGGFILLEAAMLVPIFMGLATNNDELAVAGGAAFYSIFFLGYRSAKRYDNKQREKENVLEARGNV